MESPDFQKKVEKYNELVKEIPSELNIVENDKKKFSIPSLKYAHLPEHIKDRTNKEEIINYFTDKILFIMEKRRELEWKLPENLNEEQKEQIKIEIQELADARQYQDKFLGEGNVGCVYKTKYNENTCLKYIKNLNNPLVRNDLYQEYLMHKRAFDVSLENDFTLKIPVPRHMILNTNKIKSFFSMETIQGSSFKEIFVQPNKLLEIFEKDSDNLKKLYEKVSDINFIKNIQEDLKTIEKKSGVVHGDVHGGNLMLSKYGDIYLLDFGNSIDTNIEKIAEGEYERVVEKDLNALENLIILLKSKIEEMFDNI